MATDAIKCSDEKDCQTRLQLSNRLVFPNGREVKGRYEPIIEKWNPSKKSSNPLNKLFDQIDHASYIRQQRKDDKEYKMLRRLRSEKTLRYPGKKAKSLMRFGKRNQYMVLRKGRETEDDDNEDIIAFIDVSFHNFILIFY